MLEALEERVALSEVNLWLHINCFISLPKDYLTLMRPDLQISCNHPISKNEFRQHALCLICGKILCFTVSITEGDKSQLRLTFLAPH